MTTDVLFDVSDNGLASITLNRPQAINSLTHEMVAAIGQKLKAWEQDETVHVVVFKGAGTKGFCAGGDIKSLYEARSSSSALQRAEAFFAEEYRVDQSVYRYAKPVIASLDGVVMGGGVGLTYGASQRIVTERTKWAMPEMNIGFFPDVGAAYFLNKAPGRIGRYLALTASVIGPADVLYMNGADVYMSSDKLSEFFTRLEQVEWSGKHAAVVLAELIQAYAEPPSAASELALRQGAIDMHFSFVTMEEIVASLTGGADEFAVKTRELLVAKSPSSLKITLQQLIEGEGKSLEECFATDLVLAKNFMRHPDFFEGVRSVLIDKDRNPRYVYQELSAFSDELVKSFFHGSESRS